MNVPRRFSFGVDWFDVRTIDGVVMSIREPCHEQGVGAYLLAIGGTALVIDTGMGVADLRAALGGVPGARVLLTHVHWDHVGGADGFEHVSAYDDAFARERLSRGWRPEEMPPFTPESFTCAGVVPPAWLLSEGLTIPPIPSPQFFRDGDCIHLADDDLVVVHTPGHTPDSASFFLERRGYLFTGDTLYPGAEYLHLRESDFGRYAASLRRLQEVCGTRLRAVFPGHDAPMAPPDLLVRHIAAAEGTLPVTRPDTHGLERLGHQDCPYVQRWWDGPEPMLSFSFKLRPE